MRRLIDRRFQVIAAILLGMTLIIGCDAGVSETTVQPEPIAESEPQEADTMDEAVPETDKEEDNADMETKRYTVKEYTFYKAEPELLPVGTSHIAGLYSNNSSEYHSLYVGQLMSLFGGADYTTDNNEDLISYVIGAEDKSGNVVYLDAYYGQSGPAIGGIYTDDKSKAAADELIELISGAKPKDYELTSVYEDIPATVIMGVKDGKPYYKSEISEDIMDF